MVIDAVMSDHANNERSFNCWLQNKKKSGFESKNWYQQLCDEDKVGTLPCII